MCDEDIALRLFERQDVIEQTAAIYIYIYRSKTEHPCWWAWPMFVFRRSSDHLATCCGRLIRATRINRIAIRIILTWVDQQSKSSWLFEILYWNNTRRNMSWRTAIISRHVCFITFTFCIKKNFLLDHENLTVGISCSEQEQSGWKLSYPHFILVCQFIF